MARRIEAGPLVVAVGALVLLISTFLPWFEPGLSAWATFESLDLVIAGLAVATLAAALGLVSPGLATLERRWIAPLTIAALVVVASQVIDPPRIAAASARDSGAWVALVAALVTVAGALVSFSRVSFAVTVEGRDPRRRVSAVDSRRPERPEPPVRNGSADLKSEPTRSE